MGWSTFFSLTPDPFLMSLLHSLSMCSPFVRLTDASQHLALTTKCEMSFMSTHSSNAMLTTVACFNPVVCWTDKSLSSSSWRGSVLYSGCEVFKSATEKSLLNIAAIGEQLSMVSDAIAVANNLNVLARSSQLDSAHLIDSVLSSNSLKVFSYFVNTNQTLQSTRAGMSWPTTSEACVSVGNVGGRSHCHSDSRRQAIQSWFHPWQVVVSVPLIPG